MLSGKFMIITPIAGLIKKISLNKMSHNPEADNHINVAADRNASSFTKKVDLASLESQMDKLETAPADLIKLNKVLDDDVVKKTVHDELVTKGFNFLLDSMYFTGCDGNQKILVFPPILNSLTLDNNEKVTS